MKLVERLGGGVGLPSRVLCPSGLYLTSRAGLRPCGPACVCLRYEKGLAYKTTRKYMKAFASEGLP